MDAKEALNTINNIRFYSNWVKDLEFKNIVCTAIEKQTPTRPMNGDHCPFCNEFCYRTQEKYCPNCGQAIDWSDWSES